MPKRITENITVITENIIIISVSFMNTPIRVKNAIRPVKTIWTPKKKGWNLLGTSILFLKDSPWKTNRSVVAINVMLKIMSIRKVKEDKNKHSFNF